MLDLWRIYYDIFADGAYLSLKINVFALLIGFPIAILLFAGRTNSSFFFRIISIILIEFFKGIPALVLMFWLYLCLPLISEFRISAELSAILALALNYAVNASEILRSSWGSVSNELRDNLKFFGLPRTSTILVFEAPFLLKASIPGLLALLAATIKLSAVAAFIGVPEIFHATQSVIQQTYRPVQLYTALALFYVTVVSMITITEAVVRKFLNLDENLDENRN